MSPTPIKRALISVSNKQGLVAFAKQLHELGIEIISTGGTCAALREADIPAIEVSQLTEFPEIMEGRVKTLHPKIHGGILGKRDAHADIAKQHGIDWIDLVVVNLYPFSETTQKPSTSFEEAIEQIDIGGPAMIRSAAKNMAFVTVVVDPSDYDDLIATLRTAHEISFPNRKILASKAFQHTAHYDQLIHDYLTDKPCVNHTEFPNTVSLTLTKHYDLRYGENPNQRAAAYFSGTSPAGLLGAVIHQGKALSYNNLVDADAALACVREFSSPACVIVKHANPCGVAEADQLHTAFDHALSADSMSAFGGIVALNRCCDLNTAEAISTVFFEVIIAPSFSEQALRVLAAKPNQRVLAYEENKLRDPGSWHYEQIDGGFLIQDIVRDALQPESLTVPTHRKPTDAELTALLFAWRVVKHVKSNAIVIANPHQTLGIGTGQVSRIDAVELAIRKATGDLQESALASDAFFPFRDCIDLIAEAKIHLIIQPGGSMRDQEVIQACNEHDIAMVFTGTRCFRH